MRSLAPQSSEASYLCIYYPAADPEFPDEAPTRRGGAKLLFREMLPKLHENKDNWTGGGAQNFTM